MQVGRLYTNLRGGAPRTSAFLTKRKWLSALPAVSEAAVVLGRFLDILRSGESKDLRIGKCCNMILGCFTPSFVIISCDYWLKIHSKTPTCIGLWVPFPTFPRKPKGRWSFFFWIPKPKNVMVMSSTGKRDDPSPGHEWIEPDERIIVDFIWDETKHAGKYIVLPQFINLLIFIEHFNASNPFHTPHQQLASILYSRSSTSTNQLPNSSCSQLLQLQSPNYNISTEIAGVPFPFQNATKMLR